MAHTFGKIKLSSDDPSSEYGATILTEEGFPIAEAKHNVYFHWDVAAENAARIVQCWNEYDQLKAENEALKSRVAELEKAKGE